MSRTDGGGFTASLRGALVRAVALPSSLLAPRPRGAFRAAGVRAAITRDERGIPWITGEDEADLYFAVGFAHALDRLWQMDVLRRRATGRLAEVFGPALVPEDVRVRGLALHRQAEASFLALSTGAQASLASFSSGVDEAIRRMRRRAALPPEFVLLRYRPEPWRPVDSLAIIKYLGFDLARNLRNEQFRARLSSERPDLAPHLTPSRYPLDVPVTVPGEESRAVSPPPIARMLPEDAHAWLDGVMRNGDASGSNAWAVAGARTVSGRPLLAADPHIPFAQPNLWYQIGMRLAGPTEPVTGYGVTVPGLPGLVAGANEHLAWGITNANVDTQDLAVLETDAELPGAWHEETIVLARRSDPVTVRTTGGTGCVELPGAEPGDGRSALFWSGFAATTEAEGCLGMWRARSYDEFRSALRRFGVPVLNVVVACQDGTIALKTAGRVPVREQGSGRVPGGLTDVAASWQRFLDFEDLPEVVDPPAGVVFSANNPLLPEGAAIDLGGDWAGAYRAPRLRDLLTCEQPFTAEDFIRWQQDVVNGRAARLMPAILGALAEAPLTALAACCHDLLREWDLRDSAESAASLSFLALLNELTERWLTSRLGEDLASRMPDIALQLDHLVLRENARLAIGITAPLADEVGAALTRAAARLADAFGPDPAHWRNADAHKISDAHPLSSAVPALSALFGDSRTPVGASEYSLRLMAPDARGDVKEGAPWRFVAELTEDGPALWDVLRHGSSGHPLSPHYDDQTAAHAAGKLYRVDLRHRRTERG
jgi:penicillin amidase